MICVGRLFLCFLSVLAHDNSCTLFGNIFYHHFFQEQQAQQASRRAALRIPNCGLYVAGEDEGGDRVDLDQEMPLRSAEPFQGY